MALLPNSIETQLFLGAGAIEVRIVAGSDAWQIFDAQGLQASSRIGVQLASGNDARGS